MDLETVINIEAGLAATAGEQMLYETQEWKASVANYLMRLKEIRDLVATPTELSPDEAVDLINSIKKTAFAEVMDED